MSNVLMDRAIKLMTTDRECNDGHTPNAPYTLVDGDEKYRVVLGYKDARPDRVYVNLYRCPKPMGSRAVDLPQKTEEPRKARRSSIPDGDVFGGSDRAIKNANELHRGEPA